MSSGRGRRSRRRWAWLARGLAIAALAAAACRGSSRRAARDVDDAGARPGAARTGPPPAAKAPPPLPVAAPPADAETVTGVPEAPAAAIRIVRLAAGNGPKPGRNDVVTIHLDGWRTNGDTFLTTRTRKRPIQQSLAMMAPGFAHAVTTMQRGERAMIWVPAAVGYLGTAEGTPEDLVYQVELVDFDAAPATPPDVAAPPAGAKRSASGVASVVVTPGTGSVRPRRQDAVVYHYTAWSRTGRIFDSSELRKRPKSTPMYREWPALEEALATMVVGERKRIWIPRGAVDAAGDPLIEEHAGLPEGTLCFELALVSIEPGKPLPAPPPDIGAAPADALTTAAGVRYKVLAAGQGDVHPIDTDIVEVEYTGWTSSGRPFDSTALRGQPIKLVVSRAIPGWIDGIKTMVAGQTSRFWIPEALAFKGAPGQPRGTLVFDMKLVRIVTPPPPGAGQAQPPKPFAAPPPVVP